MCKFKADSKILIPRILFFAFCLQTLNCTVPRPDGNLLSLVLLNTINIIRPPQVVSITPGYGSVLNSFDGNVSITFSKNIATLPTTSTNNCTATPIMVSHNSTPTNCLQGTFSQTRNTISLRLDNPATLRSGDYSLSLQGVQDINSNFASYSSNKAFTIAAASNTNSNTQTSISISGTVTGLSRQNLIINSGTNPNQTLTIASGSNTFAFPQNFISGETYSITMTNNSQGNVCSIANATGTAPATNITITCRPIYNLYTLETGTGILRVFETDDSGTLTYKSQFATGQTNAGILLWNNKYVITGGDGSGTCSFRSYLRNLDGSLTFSQSFTYGTCYTP